MRQHREIAYFMHNFRTIGTHPRPFTGEPLPQDAIDAAVNVLNTGRLHRYNLKEGDAGEVSSLELEFAKSIGADFCLAVASGGYALATALRAIDVKPAQKVLTNAFTLAPVPGAIASINAVPLLPSTQPLPN